MKPNMFDYKTSVGYINWFNLNQVTQATIALDGSFCVKLVGGDTITLYHNWDKRNDVARFLERVNGMKEIKIQCQEKKK